MGDEHSSVARLQDCFDCTFMDSHDVVCIFGLICGGATCWLTMWLIGGNRRWRALLFG